MGYHTGWQWLCDKGLTLGGLRKGVLTVLMLGVDATRVLMVVIEHGLVHSMVISQGFFISISIKTQNLLKLSIPLNATVSHAYDIKYL